MIRRHSPNPINLKQHESAGLNLCDGLMHGVSWCGVGVDDLLVAEGGGRDCRHQTTGNVGMRITFKVKQPRRIQ